MFCFVFIANFGCHVIVHRINQFTKREKTRTKTKRFSWKVFRCLRANSNLSQFQQSVSVVQYENISFNTRNKGMKVLAQRLDSIERKFPVSKIRATSSSFIAICLKINIWMAMLTSFILNEIIVVGWHFFLFCCAYAFVVLKVKFNTYCFV